MSVYTREELSGLMKCLVNAIVNKPDLLPKLHKFFTAKEPCLDGGGVIFYFGEKPEHTADTAKSDVLAFLVPRLMKADFADRAERGNQTVHHDHKIIS